MRLVFKWLKIRNLSLVINLSPFAVRVGRRSGEHVMCLHLLQLSVSRDHHPPELLLSPGSQQCCDMLERTPRTYGLSHVKTQRGAHQQDQGVEEEKLQNGPGSENSVSSAHSYQLRNTRRRCVCSGGLATVSGRVWPGTIVHKGKADNVLSLESQLRATSPRHTNRMNGGAWSRWTSPTLVMS